MKEYSTALVNMKGELIYDGIKDILLSKFKLGIGESEKEKIIYALGLYRQITEDMNNY